MVSLLNKIFLPSVLLLFSLTTNATTTSDDFFQILKTSTRSLEDKGAVCEEVAKIVLQKDFPAPRYTIEVGVAYGDLDNTIGELDEVIIDNQQQKVIQVVEVKCWSDFTAGLTKAKDQRQRFLKNVRSSKDLYFQSTSSDQEFPQEWFKNVSVFKSIAQKGAVASGFDLELPLTMNELMDLRLRLQRCQAWNKCD